MNLQTSTLGSPHSGEPSSRLGNGEGNNQTANPGIAELEDAIAELVRSIDARAAACLAQAAPTGPLWPQSRFDDPDPCPQIAERAHGGPSLVLQRRLRTLAGGFEKALRPLIPCRAEGGTRLVREWRGHTHTVLVREDGFEYEGQAIVMTVIAERITGGTGRAAVLG